MTSHDNELALWHDDSLRLRQSDGGRCQSTLAQSERLATKTARLHTIKPATASDTSKVKQ
jgi:hypothetical protein